MISVDNENNFIWWSLILPKPMARLATLALVHILTVCTRRGWYRLELDPSFIQNIKWLNICAAIKDRILPNYLFIIIIRSLLQIIHFIIYFN